MERKNLAVKKREVFGKKVKSLLAQKIIPGVVYGKDIKPVSIAISQKDFLKTITGGAGLNTIINLTVEGADSPNSFMVLTKSIQKDIMNDIIQHVDFKNINLKDKLTTLVVVELVGEPIGLKEGGVLVHGLREVQVKCLPNDIPDKYTLDVSGLAMNKSLHVSDLPISGSVEILTNKEDMLAFVSPPSKDEPVATAPLPAEGEAVPVEGAAPAAEGAAATDKASPQAGAEKASDAKAKPEAKAKKEEKK